METLDIQHIEFDIFKALQVIENDKDLDEIFRADKIKTPYSSLVTLAKNGMMNPDTISRVKELFEKIILVNKKPLNAYLKLGPTILDVNTPKRVKLPKHYGKKRILEDIKNNAKQTELDRAMLGLNSLRNMYATLKNRCIKEKLTDVKFFTNADYREIIATVRIVENKLKPILNKHHGR